MLAKKTSDIFLESLKCNQGCCGFCNHKKQNPCDNCAYHTTEYTKGLATNMLCDDCIEKLTKKMIVFGSVEQIKNYTHDWCDLCAECAKDMRNVGNIIDCIERLIAKVDFIAKEVDDIKKSINANE